MKKTNTKLILGTAFAAASMSLAGCSPEPPTTVYGPPSYFETTAQQTESTPAGGPPAAESTAGTTAAQSSSGAGTSETTVPESPFDPSQNIPEDVYGPPSYWGGSEEDPEEETEDSSGEADESSESKAQESSAAPTTGFRPEDNVPVAVYGPPEWFSGETAGMGMPVPNEESKGQ